jgi:predicted metal-dependent hydrolase
MKDTHELAYDTSTFTTRTLTFKLERRTRKTLAIEVRPDGSVRVKAPLKLPLGRILEQVEARSAWIVKQQQSFAELPSPPAKRAFVSGESYAYLGRLLRLVVVPNRPKRVRLCGEQLVVGVADARDTARVQALLRGWYRERAGQVFSERLEGCLSHTATFGIDHSGAFTLRRMRRRWGSCSRDGRIVLNTQLVGAPESCIDYVIVHELCHTVQHNHSRAFYDLLEACLPDWRERQGRLSSYQSVLDI